MPNRNDDDDDDRPRKRRTEDDDKVEVRRMSQSRPASTSDVEDDRPKPQPKAQARASSAFDDDDRPKAKPRRAADDDDDDRPKTKSRVAVDDDDEDDRPKAKSRRPADDNDDDDDRPKTKTRRALDDEDDDRPSKRARRDYDEDEDDDDDEPRRKKKKRPVKKQLNVVGMISLVIGIGCFIIAFTPCVPAAFALYPAIVGVIVGVVGMIIAHQSNGRQGMGLPISGSSLNVVVVLIAVAWMVFMKQVDKEFEKVGKEWEAEMAKEEARRKDELAKADTEVKNAQPGNIIRVSATQFYRAYDNDDEAADRVYMNKVIEVTGTVQSVDLDPEGESDTYLVLLKAGREEFETVDCEFIKNPAIRAQLAALRPGTQVTIRGKCLGGNSTIEACILPAPAGGP